MSWNLLKSFDSIGDWKSSGLVSFSGGKRLNISNIKTPKA